MEDVSCPENPFLGPADGRDRIAASYSERDPSPLPCRVRVTAATLAHQRAESGNCAAKRTANLTSQGRREGAGGASGNASPAFSSPGPFASYSFLDDGRSGGGFRGGKIAAGKCSISMAAAESGETKRPKKGEHRKQSRPGASQTPAEPRGVQPREQQNPGRENGPRWIRVGGFLAQPTSKSKNGSMGVRTRTWASSHWYRSGFHLDHVNAIS